MQQENFGGDGKSDEKPKGDDASGAASKVEAIDCRDAAAKLAKELPPELASQAEFIVKALQRAATHEMLGGVQTRPAQSVPTQKPDENPEGSVATKPVPAEVSRADGVQIQKPTQNPEASRKTKPNEPEVSRTDGVQIQKPTQNPEAPPETKAEAHSDLDGEECDSQGGDATVKKSGKREKTEDEKAHHAAWMRMHRQIRSGGLQATIHVVCNFSSVPAIRPDSLLLQARIEEVSCSGSMVIQPICSPLYIHTYACIHTYIHSFVLIHSYIDIYVCVSTNTYIQVLTYM